MSDLRTLLAEAGMDDGKTLLQSGNVVFRSGESSPQRLEKILEDATAKQLGLQTDYFVRSAEQWASIIEANPFQNEARRDPSHLLVVCMKDAPASGALEALREAIRGPETVEVYGREGYVAYPEGVGRSKLTMALIEKKLGTRGTGRNWNTVLKLGALSGQE